VTPGSDEQLRKEHRQWVEDSISNGNAHEPGWNESIAVGTKSSHIAPKNGHLSTEKLFYCGKND
jgi:hypothetical protein